MNRVRFPLTTPDPLLWEDVPNSQATHRVLNRIPAARFVVPRDNHPTRMLSPMLPFQQRVWVGIEAMLSTPKWVRPTALTEQSIADLPVENPVIIGRIGTPGPYSKDLLLIFSEGRPAMCLKIGTSPNGISLVRREACVVEILRKNPKLQRYLPPILFSRAMGGAYIVAEQYVAGGVCEHNVRPELLSFLDALRSEPWGSVVTFLSGCQASLTEFWKELSEPWKMRLERGLAHLQQLPRSLPAVFAHRDFTHWNIVRSRTGITVLDWEYAAESRMPMHDLYHYLLFGRTLHHRPSPRLMRETGALAVAMMKDSGAAAFAAAAPLQLLAYLLDVCILHLQSHQGRASSPLAERYGAMIESFSSWS